MFKTLNNFFRLVFFFCLSFVSFVGKNVFFSVIKLSHRCALSFSLSFEREKRRALIKKRQFLFVVIVVLCIRSRFFFVSQYREREHMKASSSKSQETDFASPLSERQKQRTLGELRFRFRASALKQSPSSDALLHDGEEEEDFLEDQLARYVEPPELPTLAMHKVFGTFLLEAFSYMRNV